jgi:hypothetical protein
MNLCALRVRVHAREPTGNTVWAVGEKITVVIKNNPKYDIP